jgi:hypothetical protein
MRPRAVATGAPPAYKPQPDNIGTSASPLTPPVRQARKLGGFSPLTPLDPGTIGAIETQVPGQDDSTAAADTSGSPGAITTSATPLLPPVRQARKLGGFSPLTPLDPSTIGAADTQVPDLDDLPSGGSIPTSTPQITSPSNLPRRPRLGVFSPRSTLNPSTSNMTGPETSDLAAPALAGSATSGGAISTDGAPLDPPVRHARKLGAFSPLNPLDPSTISAADTPDVTPTPGPTGGPRRDDDETNLQLTVQRHAMPEDLAQALSREQIPQEELTAKG